MRSSKGHPGINRIAKFGGEMLEEYSAGKVIIFKLKLPRNKICQLRGAIFSVFYNISSANFAILLI